MSRVTNVRALDSTGAVVLDNGTGDYLTGPVPTLSVNAWATTPSLKPADQ